MTKPMKDYFHDWLLQNFPEKDVERSEWEKAFDALIGEVLRTIFDHHAADCPVYERWEAQVTALQPLYEALEASETR